MKLWHLTPDAGRSPEFPAAGQRICVYAGTWPIEPGQSVWASVTVEHSDGTVEHRVNRGMWVSNDGANSYWCVELGPYAEKDRVKYSVLGESPEGEIVTAQTDELSVAPALQLRRQSYEDSLASALGQKRLARH